MTTSPELLRNAAERTIVSARVFDAPREAVFAAFADPTRLATWWGPNGFTNTPHEFELRPGGRWRHTMHGPDGTDYENECEFVEVVPPERVAFCHLEPIHRFRMEMTFAERDGGTELTWRMTFDSADECERVRSFIVPANEQNFDRLAAHLAEAKPAADSLLIVRVFDAPRELVFRAWTEADRLARWSAPHGFTIIHGEGDLRPGGRWRSGMRSPDGKDLRLGGVYREVVPPERLVFTHAWDRPDGTPGPETTVTVTLDDLGGKTRMTFRQTGFTSAASRDGHEGGWAEAFERLAMLLANP